MRCQLEIIIKFKKTPGKKKCKPSLCKPQLHIFFYMNCNLTEKQKYMMLYSGLQEYYSPEYHFDSALMEQFFEKSIFTFFL